MDSVAAAVGMIAPYYNILHCLILYTHCTQNYPRLLIVRDGFVAAAGYLKMRAPSGAKNNGLPALNPESIEVERSVDVDWWLE